METLEYWKRVEDLALTAQDMIADGDTEDAVRLRLACATKLSKVVHALPKRCEIRTVSKHAVIWAIAQVEKEQTETYPLVITGQGDYRREVNEVDIVQAEMRRAALRSRLVQAARRLLGVA